MNRRGFVAALFAAPVAAIIVMKVRKRFFVGIDYAKAEPTFVSGIVTGRFSSGPNLQNLPMPDQVARRVWKQVNYLDHYSASPETIRRLINAKAL